MILGDAYYYSKNPGKEGGERIYFAEFGDWGLDHAGTFHDDARFAFSGDLFEGAVLDLAALDEATVTSGGGYVDDGDASGRYLIGLGYQWEVVVVRLATDAYPDAYAVVPATVDWRGSSSHAGLGTGFGAAFEFDAGGRKRVLFASNEGFGLFELETPFTVPEACWNSGTDTDDHAFCDEAAPAALVRRADSALTNYNDGMNCPESTFLADEEDRRRRRRRLRGRSSGRSWS